MKSFFYSFNFKTLFYFHLLKANMYSLHDVLFGTLIASKSKFGAFPTSPHVLSTLLPNDPFEKKYIIFSIPMFTMSPYVVFNVL